MASPRIFIQLDREALPARTLQRLTELEMRQGDDAISVLRLRFALAQSGDGRYPLIDEPLLSPGAALQLQMAAPGGADRYVFAGFIAHIRPHFESIEANGYLDVVVYDPAIILDAEDRSASYPDASDADAAREILGRYGIAIDAADTAARHDKDDLLLVQRTTDWRFLLFLARRNGFVCYFAADENTGEPICRFEPLALDDDAQADLTILRDGANLTWVDFNVAYDRPRERHASAIDALAKRYVRTEVENRPASTGGSLFVDESADGLVRAGAQASSAHLRFPFPRDSALTAQGAGASLHDRLAIEVRGELDPSLYRNLLQPHRPVLIKGVGDRLTGAYYVRSVRTTMINGELAQSFVAVSNALERSGAEAFGRSAEEVDAA